MHDVLSAPSSHEVVLAWAAGPIDSPAAFSSFLWLGVVVLSVLTLVVLLLSLRRRFRNATAGAVPPFSLAELRRMKEAGTVSPAEYETLCHSEVEALGSVEGAKA